jgi:hypothetical protein
VTSVAASLPQVVGSKVERVETFGGRVQLSFERGAVVNLYTAEAGLAGRLAALPGATLAAVVETDQEIVLRFFPGTDLRVDLSNDARRGPEALELIVPGEPIVIW